MLVGFKCPKMDGSPVEFDYCLNQCEVTCLPVAVLYEIIDNIREIKPDVYSVTELLKPLRIIVYSRIFDYFENPFRMVFAIFGTAWHAMIERGHKKLREAGIERYSVEKENYFEHEINIEGRRFVIRGQPDEYDKKTDTLIDHKTIKYYYDLENMLNGYWQGTTYHWQINLYRRYKFPNCKEMKIVALIKDYNSKLEEQGIKQIETIKAPWIDDKTLDLYIEEKLRGIVMAEQNLDTIPDCRPDETWNTRRCRRHCPIRDFCPQHRMRRP